MPRSKHQLEFETVIAKLREWREQVIVELRSPDTHDGALQVKRQIDTAISCLELCQLHQIHPSANVTVLPDTETRSPFGDYRIVEDHETENRECWTELKIDGHLLALYPGDIIIG